MGQCLERAFGNEDDERRAILRNNPWMRKLPFISSRADLQPLHLLEKMPGEYCWSPNLSPAFVAELCYSGFLPMAELAFGGRCVLLPKLHMQRCVMLNLDELHISRKVRKRAGGFHLTLDTCFDEVVRGCRQQHGNGCWLHPPLVHAFRQLHTPNVQHAAAAARPLRGGGGASDQQAGDSGTGSPSSSTGSPSSVTGICVSGPDTPYAGTAAPATGFSMPPPAQALGEQWDCHAQAGEAAPGAGAWAKAGCVATAAAEARGGAFPAQNGKRTVLPAAPRTDAALADSPAVGSAAASPPGVTPAPQRAVRFHSVELWCGDQLVAGELGYSFGACYTSISGFYKVPSSGAVQCVATARVLRQSGIRFWDLGMELPYKLQLGARCIPRGEFLSSLQAARDAPPLRSPQTGRVWVSDLLGQGAAGGVAGGAGGALAGGAAAPAARRRGAGQGGAATGEGGRQGRRLPPSASPPHTTGQAHPRTTIDPRGTGGVRATGRGGGTARTGATEPDAAGPEQKADGAGRSTSGGGPEQKAGGAGRSTSGGGPEQKADGAGRSTSGGGPEQKADGAGRSTSGGGPEQKADGAGRSTSGGVPEQKAGGGLEKKAGAGAYKMAGAGTPEKGGGDTQQKVRGGAGPTSRPSCAIAYGGDGESRSCTGGASVPAGPRGAAAFFSRGAGRGTTSSHAQPPFGLSFLLLRPSGPSPPPPPPPCHQTPGRPTPLGHPSGSVPTAAPTPTPPATAAATVPTAADAAAAGFPANVAALFSSPGRTASPAGSDGPSPSQAPERGRTTAPPAWPDSAAGGGSPTCRARAASAASCPPADAPAASPISLLGHTVSSTLHAVSSYTSVRDAMRKNGWEGWTQPWADRRGWGHPWRGQPWDARVPSDAVLVSVGGSR